MRPTFRASQYMSFFYREKKLHHFFGRELLEYIAVVSVLCLVALFFHDTFITLPVLPKILLFILLVGMNLEALGSILPKRLSSCHDDYLVTLGFQPTDTRFLTRVIALPINFIQTILFSIALLGTFTWAMSIVLSVTMFLAMEVLTPYIVQSFSRFKSKLKKRKGKTKNVLKVSRSFSSPYRSFFVKDIKATTFSEKLSIVMMVLFGFLIMLISGVIEGEITFGICFYLSLTLVVFQCGYGVFSLESRVHSSYYVPLLGLRDIKLLMYKQPLQILIITVSSFCYVLFGSVLFGFEISKVVICFCIFLYIIIASISMNWLYIDRIGKANSFDSFYQLATLPIVMIPFLSIICAVSLCIKNHRLNHKTKLGE